MRSASSLIVGKALATATAYPLACRNAWSFSASPTDTTLCAERPRSSSAACKPLALLTPGGSTMTAPLLNTICSSSPCSRIASSTSFSLGSQVATMERPTESGVTPFLRKVSTNAGDGSGPSGVSFFVAGSKSNAPFSATIRSKRSIRGKTRVRSGSSRPVTRRSRLPDRLKATRASAVASSTIPSCASVPS